VIPGVHFSTTARRLSDWPVSAIDVSAFAVDDFMPVPPVPGHASRRCPACRLLAWAALFTAIGTLNAVHRYLGAPSGPESGLLLDFFVQELTGSWTVGLLFPLVLLAVRRIRRVRGLLARGACHLGALLLFSALHTGLIWAARAAAYPLLGFGPSQYALTWWRAAMEFPSDVIVYGVITAITWLVDHYRMHRARELRAAQLESALADARLEALRLQLNPHFLFNALNAVSEVMYDQPRVADEMLARIGELLRATLAADAQEHTLADELRLLGLYVDIQRARFGEQLHVGLDTAPELARAQVPFLVLQPLVENAIEHGGSHPGRRVDISAAVVDGHVELQVRDHGAGADARGHAGHGIGLGNLRSRLRHLYGEAAGLVLEPADGGGMRVRLWLPLHAGVPA
jgi:signal transduction histidine kinase